MIIGEGASGEIAVAVTVDAGAIVYLHEKPGVSKMIVSTANSPTAEGWPAVMSQHGWSGGELTIRTENVTTAEPLQRGAEIMPPGNYVLVEMKDSGTGIPPDIIDRIFEPFFSTKAIGSGTGLGLSTVYGIVRQTGGFVFVDGGLGLGASFRIYLPQHMAGIDKNVKSESGEDGPRDLTGIGTILLVEDEDAVRLFSARALRNKGYQVLEARSGEAALEIINEHLDEINLIISDVVMPKMDGPTMIKEVRTRRRDMPVIFISGYAEDAFRRRVDTGEEAHFLLKPFTLKQLAAKVKEVLDQPQVKTYHADLVE